jgi:hypothetical protein
MTKKEEFKKRGYYEFDKLSAEEVIWVKEIFADEVKRGMEFKRKWQTQQ